MKLMLVAVLMLVAIFTFTPNSLAEPIIVEQVGTSWVSDTGKTTPILTIKIGNPERGELLAGPNGGIDGMLWTPVQGKLDRWLVGNHRNPRKALKETGDLTQVVRSRYEVGPPAMLHGIDPTLTALVKFIVHYDAGGMRIALRTGTSQVDAGALAVAIQSRLEHQISAGPDLGNNP